MAAEHNRSQHSSHIAIILVIVIVILGASLLYVVVSSQEDIASLHSQLDLKNQSILNLQRTISSDNESITSLNLTLAKAEANITQLLQEQQQNENASTGKPTLIIWTVSQSIQSGHFLAEGVPDTFDYHDNFTATATITVDYFSFSQFAQYATGQTVTGSYQSVGPTTSSNDTFTLAEGCGGYVAVYTGQATITPNISITYNPASSFTGTCSG